MASGEQTILKMKGRLDAYWSDHLSKELSNILREGADHILLDLSEVHYISSAGIRVLLDYYQQLKGIQGHFGIAQISENAKSVLDMSGLSTLLLASAAPIREVPAEQEMTEKEGEFARFLVFPEDPDATIRCRLIGNPDLLDGCRFEQQNLHQVSFPDTSFGLGLGAFGETFEECRERFGEFLAVSGTAVYLPTDGTNVPDYVAATGSLIPEMSVLYGASLEGDFKHHFRFETKKDLKRISLRSLVEFCFELAETDSAGVVMVAESAGLMGATLTRSPAIQSSVAAPFGFPEIREWLSFTSERSYSQSLVLVVGIVDRSGSSDFSRFLRPMEKGSELLAHFHAAAFPFRPLKKGQLDLKSTVNTLFESERIQGILHLLHDDRNIEGAGESEFIRGACWLGPISDIVKGSK